MKNRLRTRSVRVVAAAGIGALALWASGCGTAEADLEAGKESFIASCGSCHMLEDAGTTAPARDAAGPDLDDAFRASRQAGMDDAQFRGTVKRWIKIAQAPMPRDLVTGQDAENVAAYVASVAGTSDESPVRAAVPFAPENPDPPRQALPNVRE